MFLVYLNDSAYNCSVLHNIFFFFFFFFVVFIVIIQFIVHLVSLLCFLFFLKNLVRNPQTLYKLLFVKFKIDLNKHAILLFGKIIQNSSNLSPTAKFGII